MKTLKFYKCKHCGNVIVKVVDKIVPVFCCGEVMEEIHANTTEAALEKHLPIVEAKNGVAEVKVGSVAHPMMPEHYINFIAVETEAGYCVAVLQPGSLPEAKFYIGESKLMAVYEYCNLHGLWKAEKK